VSPTAVLISPKFLGHDTGDHPEFPGRTRAIYECLGEDDLLTGRPEVQFGPALQEIVSRVHDQRYLQALDDIVELGGGWIDNDTMCGVDSVEIAYLAAGAAVAAVDAVLDGQVRRTFAMGRPPGHHALATRGMGFCLLNSIAIAAQRALDR
jgi:acetoin utilization deacetylase AcuC-like enzyme